MACSASSALVENNEAITLSLAGAASGYYQRGSTFEVKLGERRVVTCCKHAVAAARDSKFKVVSASYGY